MTTGSVILEVVICIYVHILNESALMLCGIYLKSAQCFINRDIRLHWTKPEWKCIFL